MLQVGELSSKPVGQTQGAWAMCFQDVSSPAEVAVALCYILHAAQATDAGSASTVGAYIQQAKFRKFRCLAQCKAATQKKKHFRSVSRITLTFPMQGQFHPHGKQKAKPESAVFRGSEACDGFSTEFHSYSRLALTHAQDVLRFSARKAWNR